MAAGRAAESAEGACDYMKIKTLEQDKDSIRLLVEGFNIEALNSLRRAMIAEVPVMAIDEVKFKKNSSALYDEMIALRLGLVPLKTDLKTYDLMTECKCKGKGCARCQTTFALKVKGPATVYASDLKPKDPHIKPVYQNMIITKLLDGQELELEAVARLGKGNEHAKFAPCMAVFQRYPEIEIKKNCNLCKKCINACPKGIFKEGSAKAIVDKDKILECTLCKACEDACDRKALKVSGKEDSALFYIESWGQLGTDEIVKTAVDILVGKLKELDKAL